MTNMNIFELEMQMKERMQEAEKLSFSVWAAHVPMLDWLLGAAAVGSIGSMLA